MLDPCRVENPTVVTFRTEPSKEENMVELALRDDTLMVDPVRVDPNKVDTFSVVT